MSSIAAACGAPGCAIARTFTSVIPAVANGRHVVEPERLDDWCSWASARHLDVGRSLSSRSHCTLMFAASSGRHENVFLGCERFRMAAAEQGRRRDHQNDG